MVYSTIPVIPEPEQQQQCFKIFLWNAPVPRSSCPWLGVVLVQKLEVAVDLSAEYLRGQKRF